jgi:hypothetical protein
MAWKKVGIGQISTTRDVARSEASWFCLGSTVAKHLEHLIHNPKIANLEGSDPVAATGR